MDIRKHPLVGRGPRSSVSHGRRIVAVCWTPRVTTPPGAAATPVEWCGSRVVVSCTLMPGQRPPVRSRSREMSLV